MAKQCCNWYSSYVIIWVWLTQKQKQMSSLRLQSMLSRKLEHSSHTGLCNHQTDCLGPSKVRAERKPLRSSHCKEGFILRWCRGGAAGAGAYSKQNVLLCHSMTLWKREEVRGFWSPLSITQECFWNDDRSPLQRANESSSTKKQVSYISQLFFVFCCFFFSCLLRPLTIDSSESSLAGCWGGKSTPLSLI